MMSWPIQCAACVEQRLWTTFENEDCLREHIAVQHVSWMPYECYLCPKALLPTKVLLKQHYEDAHPRMEVKAIFTYKEDKKKELSRILLLSKTLQRSMLVKRELPDKNEPTDLPASNNNVTEMERPIYSENLVEMSEMEMEHKTDQETAPIELKENPQNSHETDAEPSLSECRLCGERLHSNEQRARKQHIWQRHMPQAPIHCRLCSWKQQYVAGNENRNCLGHIRTAHPNAKGKPLNQTFKDNRKKLAKKLANTLAQAFAASPTVTTTSSVQNTDCEQDAANSRGTCQLCQRTVRQKSQHIWQHHLQQKRYRCRFCSYRSSQLRYSEQHAATKHSDRNGIRWTDHIQELLPRYKELYLDAFEISNQRLQKRHPLVIEQPVKTDIPKENAIQPTNGIWCNTCRYEISHNHKEKHLWLKHLKMKRYSCRMCDYTAKYFVECRRHASAEHGYSDAESCITDRKDELADEYTVALKTAFGNSNVGKAELPKSDCNTCGRVIWNRGDHVWQMHVAAKRYECTLCEYSTVFGNAVRGHVKAQHKGADVRECVVDRKMQLAEEFADAFEMAFGSHPVEFCD